jgi:heme exporter protein C
MKPFQLANPTRLLLLTERLTPKIGVLALVALVFGLYLSLVASPPDYQQGETVRIMYVHVASAWMAMGLYTGLAISSASFLIWRHQTAFIVARVIAPVGAAFTLACIITGAIWGKPMWGAWWVWDARLTSVLVLLFLYIGYMALGDALDYSEHTAKACSILALIGVANIPVIRFSVEWWNTLHQPASLIRSGGPAIQDTSMLAAMLAMGAAFTCVAMWMVLTRLQTALILLKKRRQRT